MSDARDRHLSKPQVIDPLMSRTSLFSQCPPFCAGKQGTIGLLTVTSAMPLPSSRPLQGSVHRMGTKMNSFAEMIWNSVCNIYFSIKTLSNLALQGNAFCEQGVPQ